MVSSNRERIRNGGKVKYMKFEVGKEYKTIRKNMEIGVRTFKVEKITRKNWAVMLSGAINGVYPLKVDYKGNEFIDLGFNKDYCNPSALDIL